MKRPPRRDIIHRVGERAAALNAVEAIIAWRELAERLQELGDRDVPKFRDLLRAIYSAMARAKNKE